MSEMSFKELGGDKDRQKLARYLDGLVHLRSCAAVERSRKRQAIALAAFIIVSVACIIFGINVLVSGHEQSDDFAMGFFAVLIGFAFAMVSGIVFESKLWDLSNPDSKDMRKLDMAISSSDTVKSLVMHIRFYNYGKLTTGLINELFDLAKDESAGSYARLWDTMSNSTEGSDKKSTEDTKVD